MRFYLFLIALFLVGCPEEPNSQIATDTEVNQEDFAVILLPDLDLEDMERNDFDSGVQDSDVSPDLGGEMEGGDPQSSDAQFGEPCRSNLDCETGFCIASPQGFLCSQTCTSDDECEGTPLPMRCQLFVENLGPDRVRICSPIEDSLCQPCFRDDHCFGGRCISGPLGNVCSVSCSEDRTCPDGSACLDEAEGRRFDLPQCVPDFVLCGCGEDTRGETRSCVRVNDTGDGRCFGTETCDPDVGWSGCDAPTPSSEMCDGVDNDCNGAIDDGLPTTSPCQNMNEFGSCEGVEVCTGASGWSCIGPTPVEEVCDGLDNDCDLRTDEGFANESGVFNSIDHCGGCFISCLDQLPLATEVTCDTSEGEPVCRALSCREGFFLSDEGICTPLTSSLCEPCSLDSDCSEAVGDRCLNYGDDNGFCGRACDDNSPFGNQCPDGFSCDQGQCRLDTGSCLCSVQDLFNLPCTITSPLDANLSCLGIQRCDRGTLSSCELPAELCDGFDDDCDGTVDETFIDSQSGLYATVEHCGRCNLSCDALITSEEVNGDSYCDVSTGVATCRLQCTEGYVDVNQVQADGCECQVITPNLDDPDLEGIDANCDGIDGEIPRGVFVSPSGDDSAAGTIDAPLKTLQVAIDQAGGARDHIYVAAGVYTEAITLKSGVSMFGGYSADFKRRDLRGNETAIFPPLNVEGDRLGTVTGLDINQETRIDGFTIAGFIEGRPSTSSYTVYLKNCSELFVLTNNVIRAGSGGPGLRGTSGGAGLDAPNTSTAGAVERFPTNSSCFASVANTSSGGVGGSHMCMLESGQAVSTDGGRGGNATCPIFNQPEESGQRGSVTGYGGTGGAGGYNQQLINNNGRCLCLVPNVAGSTEVGVPGESGRSGDLGVAGSACSATTGRAVNGHWVSSDRSQDLDRGGNGGSGLPGGGGGGGGAGSGLEYGFSFACNDLYNESIGGGGGGGGAGGCGGNGGGGGASGGGSFAVFIFYTQTPLSLPTITNNRIERGFGGSGGDGGEGGEGGKGGLGSEGAALRGEDRETTLACADPGGRGGDGGSGGDGGGGGGGCGGISAGIFISGGGSLSSQNMNQTNLFPQTGAAGLGGRGGLSLGELGEAGVDGQYVEVAR